VTNGRRLIGAALVAIATALLIASQAHAHATLLGSTPAPDSVLGQTPQVISLRFSEPVDVIDDSIRLIADDGASVDVGPVYRDGGDDTMAVDVTTQLSGTYVVAWQAVSVDSHPVSGAFSFSVGEPTSTDPALIDEVLAGTGESGPSEVVLGVGRWLSYAGVAVLVGGFSVLAWCAPALLDGRRARLLLAAAAAVGVAGTLVMIGARAAAVGGGPFDPDGWSSVLGSRSGRWWLVRILLLAVAPLVLLARGRTLTRPPVLASLAVYAATLLAVVAAGGHAVTGIAIPLGFAATWVHLAAMSIWAGGLVVIVTIVGRRGVWDVLARFSPVALGAVVALAVTGTINAWRQLGSFEAITETSYGRWLIVKLVVVAGVVAVAAVSRWTLRHPAATAPALSTVGAAGPPRAERRLRRSVAVEAIGTVVVLAATAGLVNSPPPRALAVDEAVPVTVVANQGDWSAQIDLVPARTGGTTMHVTLFSTASDVQVADEITVSASLPAQQLGPIEIPVIPVAANHVTTSDADFPVPGQWEVAVTARFGEFDQVVLTADVDVR
jgi:copper transport protein